MSEDFLTAQWVIDWMQTAHRLIGECSHELGGLDRAIGDGDHGENMRRGLTAVVSTLSDQATGAGPAELFRMIGRDLVFHVGGAAGPLYGTAFLWAAKTLGDKGEIFAGDIAALIRAGRDGIVHRGHAAPGDKTMVDVWDAAAIAADAACAAHTPVLDVLDAVARAARDGARSTEPMQARRGRASYVGERARGHRDPGAQSSALLFQAAYTAAQGCGGEAS